MQDMESDRGPSVTYTNVSLTLGNTEVLGNISFSVDPGTIHCLIGPNGGGKTSLLRSLLGMMPHKGEITISGEKEARIGYVPQGIDFDRTLPINVEDFLAVMCQNRAIFSGIGKNKRAVIATMLSHVQMEGKEKYLLGHLSGGEMQRLLIAQALFPSPSLLLLDEPLTGLDRKGSGLLGELVFSLKDKGTTIIWIHHDLNQVKKIADKVTCVNREIIFSGSPGLFLSDVKTLDLFSLSA